jgi:hypothetical protein
VRTIEAPFAGNPRLSQLVSASKTPTNRLKNENFERERSDSQSPSSGLTSPDSRSFDSRVAGNHVKPAVTWRLFLANLKNNSLAACPKTSFANFQPQCRTPNPLPPKTVVSQILMRGRIAFIEMVKKPARFSFRM